MFASEFPVRKYLPHSYRQAFNFTTPRTRAAVTDDSYHCAVRGAVKVPGFKRSSDEISWGKVFAYALRQPLLARELGMIYSATIEIKDEIEAGLFEHGGWFFVDLAEGSAFREQEDKDPDPDHPFVKKYAVRIPALVARTERSLFAPILFPVLFKAKASDPDKNPDGTFDQLLIEAAEYDDGFAKIVHAMQPQSRNLLAESPEQGKPVKDAGIRLGWDDEQILIWYLRQLAKDETVIHPDHRLDAPLGVFGYAIDVRETAKPPKPWQTLNKVKSRAALSVSVNGDEPITLDRFNDELPYQVYPMQLDGNDKGDFWLPMYFANWTGHSMVLPDQDAAEIYHTNAARSTKDPGTGVEGSAPNQLNKIYEADGLKTGLRYGRKYDFRVRLRGLERRWPGAGEKPGGGKRVIHWPLHVQKICGTESTTRGRSPG